MCNMTKPITLDDLKAKCEELLYHIPLRMFRGDCTKNKIVYEYTEKAIEEISLMTFVDEYPEDYRETIVRIVTPNNKIAKTRFGRFFFIGDEMFLISEDKKMEKYHRPEVADYDKRLEVLKDSTTYTVKVLFAGIYTGFKDINGELIFTGDIVRGDNYIAGVDILFDRFQHIYDNVSLPLSEIIELERITSVFYDLRRNESEVDISGRCNGFAQCGYWTTQESRLEWIKNNQLYLDMPEEYKINIYSNNSDNSARFVLGYTNTNPLFVIGVNPSTADDSIPDQTIRRVIGYARRNNFNGFIMLNVYPHRATNPNDLHDECDETLHQENIRQIVDLLKQYSSPTILLAFGDSIMKRPYLKSCFKDILDALEKLPIHYKQLGYTRTKKGHPRHPSRGEYLDLRDFCVQDYLCEHGL